MVGVGVVLKSRGLDLDVMVQDWMVSDGVGTSLVVATIAAAVAADLEVQGRQNAVESGAEDLQKGGQRTPIDGQNGPRNAVSHGPP